MGVCVYLENPFYKLLTNRTIYAPLASSPVISIIVAIDSDGTTSQQDDITVSLILDDEDFMDEFEQDSTDFQLYHYMFPPLRRRNMGQYMIYSGIKTSISMYVCIKLYVLYIYSGMNDELQIAIEVIITTEGNVIYTLTATYVLY